jgi:hypothetical protein
MEAHRVVRRRGSHILLDNRLTDGGEVVNLTRRPTFNPRKIPGTTFSVRSWNRVLLLFDSLIYSLPGWWGQHVHPKRRQTYTRLHSVTSKVSYSLQFLNLSCIDRLNFTRHTLWYCQVYQWLKTGFGLVIGFIDHLQVVTTISSYTLKIT